MNATIGYTGPRQRYPCAVKTVRMLAVLVVASAAGAVVSCGPRAPEGASKAERAAEPVEVGAVQRLPVTVWVDASGTLEPDERVQVAAKVAGRVASVEHDLGDRVADGEVLARLDDADYQIALTQRKMALAEALAELGLAEPPAPGFDVAVVPRVKAARAQAANAAAKRDRIAELMQRDRSAFSQQDFDDVKTAADVASANAEVAALDARTLLATVESRRADIAKAQHDLDETVVRVPRPARTEGASGRAGDGYGVSARSVSVGDLVAVGSTLYTLVEDNPLKFTARVPERYMGAVKSGQKVELTLEALAEKASGTVKRVSPVVDAESRMFQVQVEVPNSARALKAGAFARARIAVDVRAGATFVPNEALVTFAGVQKIFSIKDGKAVEHLVEKGERRDGLVEVVSGLDGVDAVVVKGAGRLTRGTPVKMQASTGN